jgi:norsolorinic acid ketoreductase
VKSLLLRPYTTVIAGVRDPANTAAKALNSLPTASDTRLIIVKIDSLSETDPQAAVQLLQSEHGIEKLDIVIANAGMAKHAGPAYETPIAEMRDHFEVNTIGPLVLFQATKPLLERSSLPKFVVVTSRIGSIGHMDFGQLPVTAYGSSKAAVNYIVRKIHFENPDLIAFPIHPGYVVAILKRSCRQWLTLPGSRWAQTDMGNEGAAIMGIPTAPITVEQSVSGVLAKVGTPATQQIGRIDLLTCLACSDRCCD